MPSFTTMLEGTLNQIWLKCPRWIANCKRCHGTSKIAFSIGLKKHIRDSIQYLYSNLVTTYSELMVAAHKAESKTEESWDKVRAKSAMNTQLVDGSKELSNEIARLMVALARAEQGNCPASAPNSPRHWWSCGRGCNMDRNTPNCP